MSRYKVFLLTLIFLFSSLGMACGATDSELLEIDNVSESELNQPLHMGALLARYILSVFGILILTYLGVKFFARQVNPSFDSGDWLQIMDYMPLGTNRGFYLVEIEGKGYVLGITEQQINVLSTIEDQERLDELRGQSLKKNSIKNSKFNLWKNKNRNFPETLQKHINETQILYSKHKRGDKTYEE